MDARTAVATTRATAQMVGEVLIERYGYLPGPASAGETHLHEQWQWCLYVGGVGSYAMRSGRVVFPSGTLTVIAPGQAHAAQDPGPRRDPSACLVAYFPSGGAPVHRGVVVNEARARRAFAALWPAHDELEAEVALARFLSIVNGEGEHDLRPSPAPAALQNARDYLHDKATEPVALAQLAAVAGLSPAHLVRAFGRAYGLPPHRYQTALRIDRAKRLLARGDQTISAVAHAVGFTDHAHFTRTFRRWVGFAPSRYAKIVQDNRGHVRLHQAHG